LVVVYQQRPPEGGHQVAKLEAFSKASDDGRCPKCGYAVMKSANPVLGSTALGVATLGWVGGNQKKIKSGACGAKFIRG